MNTGIEAISESDQIYHMFADIKLKCRFHTNKTGTSSPERSEA